LPIPLYLSPGNALERKESISHVTQSPLKEKKGMLTTQSLFEGTMIRQGCRKKSYRGNLDLTLKLTTSDGKNKESLMIVIVTLTHKNIRRPAS
jgi:hypothetical protein